jgi:predicted GNAT superfamily acetyltransferase
MTDPWETARAAAVAADVEIRRLDAIEDADRVNDVIDRTWGGQHLDREVIRALGYSGNVVLGAEAEGRLIGFALGWAGVDDAGLHVHSHMVAAVPDARHRGVGYALKLAQRAQALDQGIDTMRWTFDPMVARNAWFNLGKLGAIADRFFRDFYGAMTDRINVGDRSDRLVVRWDLRRDPAPRDVGDDVVEVPVPEDHEAARDVDPSAFADDRDRVASRIADAIAAGRVAAGFSRERSSYLFVPGSEVGA